MYVVSEFCPDYSKKRLGFLFFSAGERRDPLLSQPSLAVGTTTVLCQILQGDVALPLPLPYFSLQAYRSGRLCRE